MRRFARPLVLALVVGACQCFAGVPAASAAACAHGTASSGATASVCITDVAAGATLSGNVTVTATASWDRASASDVFGCPGERKTPSGCVTWTLNGTYVLTHLYRTPGTSVYRFTLHTAGF